MNQKYSTLESNPGFSLLDNPEEITERENIMVIWKLQLKRVQNIINYFRTNHGMMKYTSLYALLHITASVFPHNKLGWLFGIVEWIHSEQYPWYWRK
jgi:hypothetical protein